MLLESKGSLLKALYKKLEKRSLKEKLLQINKEAEEREHCREKQRLDYKRQRA